MMIIDERIVAFRGDVIRGRINKSVFAAADFVDSRINE